MNFQKNLDKLLTNQSQRIIITTEMMKPTQKMRSIMVKCTSVNASHAELLADLRTYFYGSGASAKEYRDSHIINTAIQAFNAPPKHLMDYEISALDKETKVAKTVTYRLDAYQKIHDLAGVLGISDAETLRRILFFTRLRIMDKNGNDKLSTEKSEEQELFQRILRKVILIRKHLGEIENSLQDIERLFHTKESPSEECDAATNDKELRESWRSMTANLDDLPVDDVHEMITEAFHTEED